MRPRVSRLFEGRGQPAHVEVEDAMDLLAGGERYGYLLIPSRADPARDRGPACRHRDGGRGGHRLGTVPQPSRRPRAARPPGNQAQRAHSRRGRSPSAAGEHVSTGAGRGGYSGARDQALSPSSPRGGGYPVRPRRGRGRVGSVGAICAGAGRRIEMGAELAIVPRDVGDGVPDCPGDSNSGTLGG